MTVALFDLDNTLLDGDSDYLWGEFLCDQGVVDRARYRSENARYYQAYRDGTLDIHEFLAFGLRPLAEHTPEQLHHWRTQFIRDCIVPIIPASSRALLEKHREKGHQCVIVTATNRFITEPIAAELGVDHLLASTPEQRNGGYTGRLADAPCFREGKVQHVSRWLNENNENWQESWFYSDSHNDLPLLERVSHPVVVNGDAALKKIAGECGWPLLDLRTAPVQPARRRL